MFEICFFVEDMTSLRYAIPFIKKTKELFGLNVPLVYDGSKNTGKYNSILLHFSKFKNIVEKNTLESIDLSIHRIQSDKVVCVENVNTIVCKKIFSIQHGFDYRNLASKNKNSTYLVTDKIYAKELNSLGVKTIVQPSPISFWDWNEHLEFIKNNGFDITSKSVLFFYPEQGYIDLFKSVYDNFVVSGFKTYVKQRKKSQIIDQRFVDAYYDDIWYPSESITLTMLSDIIVGFGTSAYFDTVKLNRTFVDFPVTSYSKQYLKPTTKNFLIASSSNQENIKQLLFSKIDTEPKIHNCNVQESIKTFLNEIL